MARISEKTTEKSKGKLGSLIWSSVVIGILAAVVVTGIVLLIVYLTSLNNTGEDDNTVTPQFTDVTSITYEDLGSVFSGTTPTIKANNEGLLYVLVYSDEYKLSDDVKAEIEAVYGKDGFYLLNTYDETNRESTMSAVDDLAELTTLVPTLSETKPAYLLVFEDYQLDDKIPNSTKSIIYALDNLLG